MRDAMPAVRSPFRPRFTAAAVLVATATFAARGDEGDAKPSDAAARAAIDRGLTLQREGKFDEAIRALDEARKMAMPDELAAEALVELAETWFRKGKEAGEEEDASDPEPSLRRAVELFAEAVAKYPKVESQVAYAAYMVGSSQILLGDMQQAFEAYKAAYFGYKESTYGDKSLVRLGICLASLGMARQATQVFQSYIDSHRADPKEIETLQKLGEYMRQLEIVGGPAPPIRVERWLEGAVTTGLGDLRGEVVVVVFFATWCKICSKELPHLKREMARWKDKGAVFIGVADPDDPKVKEPVEFYVKRNAIDFHDIALDKGSRTWHPYRVSGLPAAVVIDRRGIVRWRGHFTFMGHTLLEKLLSEK